MANHAEPRGRSRQTFYGYASYWLEARSSGVLGVKPLAANTKGNYLRLLRKHLLPYFGRRRLDEIDAALCLAFKAHKLREAVDLRAALAAGAELRDKQGRRVVPLGPSSIRDLLRLLARILDDAFEDGEMDRNPARGRRLRVAVPKPALTFLELDELVDLVKAAAEADMPATPSKVTAAGGDTATKVAALLSRGQTKVAIASELGLAKSTVSYHAQRLGQQGKVRYDGRAFVIQLLSKSGVRNSELCDLQIGRMRLHDPAGARLHIPDSKTDTGIRVVEMTPDLAEAAVDHIDRLRRAGRPTGPTAHLVQNARGGRISRERIAEFVREARETASRKRVERGLPPLARVTPHSLRRTYISMALLANSFDIKWVMGQVGHSDSKMTIDVYAQLEQRIKREHGVRFDALVRDAELQFHGAEIPHPHVDSDNG